MITPVSCSNLGNMGGGSVGRISIASGGGDSGGKSLSDEEKVMTCINT